MESTVPAEDLALFPHVPVHTFDGNVAEKYIDANGHMGAATYYSVFQQGLARLFRPLGFGDAYRARGFTVFQREAHITYERELRLGDEISIRAWLVAYDKKRFHHFHEMRLGRNGPLAASIEYITTNVSLAERRSTPFPDDVLARLEALSGRFKRVDMPLGIGRKISLKEI